MNSRNEDEFVQQFRGVMGQLPTGVSVLLAEQGGSIRAMTAGSVVLASIDPPLVAVFVARGSRMHDHLLEANRFTISVLAEGDSLSARRFARSREEDASGPPALPEVVERADGPPVLRSATSWLDCVVEQVTQVGDHSCFVGRVVAMDRLRGAEPLVYYRGRFHALGPAVHPRLPAAIDPVDLLTNW